MFPLKVRGEVKLRTRYGEVKRQKTRVMGLLCDEACMILTSTVFDWSTREADGRGDGR